jgi:hypothetical protein
MRLGSAARVAATATGIIAVVYGLVGGFTALRLKVGRVQAAPRAPLAP